MSGVIVRRMTRNDLDHIIELEHKSFSIPWTRGMFEEELNNPDAFYIALEKSEHVLGYAGFWKILDEGHITNVAVHPDFRRQGFGRLLIENVISLAKEQEICALTLEVRVSNMAAISLYASFGFISFGRRKGYYQDNKEDALIMWLNKF